MERTTILQHLALAEKHLAQGEAHLAHQRRIIETLGRDGHDTTSASDLLTLLEAAQRMHRVEHERLRAELNARPPEARHGR